MNQAGGAVCSAGAVQLCRASYQILAQAQPINVDLLCQTVELRGRTYAWIDGVDLGSPLLVPVDNLKNFTHAGTLGQYLRDERHLELGRSFNDLLDICLARDLSATVIVRACELMHADALNPYEAIDEATAWGGTIIDIDWASSACRSLPAGC